MLGIFEFDITSPDTINRAAATVPNDPLLLSQGYIVSLQTHLLDVACQVFTRVLSGGSLGDSLSWYVPQMFPVHETR